MRSIVRNKVKSIRFLPVCLLVGVLLSGCNKAQVADNNTKSVSDGTTVVDNQISENKPGEYEVHDELIKTHQSNAIFVAVKLPIPSDIQWYIDEVGGGAYYQYYRIFSDSKYYWTNIDFMELPIEMQDGEFAYVKADTTFMTGGIAGVTDISFQEIKECRKINLEEAAELIDILDLYKYEKQYLDGFYGIARHSRLKNCLVVGELWNRYDFREKQENSFYGLVTVYLDTEVIGQYERLEFVDDYLVFFKSGDDEETTELPENITVENIEVLLASGKQYDDSVFVIYKRERDVEEDLEVVSSEEDTNESYEVNTTEEPGVMVREADDE